MYFKNKKGQIPILMLFVITIVLVILSLFSFASFGKTSGTDKASGHISGMLVNISDSEALVLKVAKNSALNVIGRYSDDLEKDFSEEVHRVWLSLKEVASYGNFSARVRDREFNFSEVDESDSIFKLEIKDLFVQAEAGKN